MKRVTGVIQAERRGGARRGVNLRIVYVWNGFIFEADTLDISETGMRLQTHVDLGVGTQLETRFPSRDPATDGGAMQKIVSEVRWTGFLREAGDNSVYQCGLRFLSRTDNFIWYLRSTLREKDLEDLPLVEAEHVTEVTEPSPEGFHGAASLLQAVSVDEALFEERRQQADMLVAQARAASDGGDLATAARLLEDAVARSPQSHLLLEALGGVMYKQGDIVAAAKCFDLSLRLRQELGET